MIQQNWSHMLWFIKIIFKFIKVLLQSEVNKKKRKFQKNLVLQIISHPKIKSKTFYIPLWFWLLKRTYQLMTLQNKFRRMLDKTDSHWPTFDAKTVRSEIENLGELCKEAVKRELEGKYISITTDHWTSKKT